MNFCMQILHIVSIDTTNNFKWIILYLSIVYSIMSFAVLHGIVVISLTEAVKYTSCTFVFLSDVHIMFCFKSKFVML